MKLPSRFPGATWQIWVTLAALLACTTKAAFAQAGWEASVLVAKTRTSARFDALTSANRPRMGYAPAVALTHSSERGALRIEAMLVRKGFERTQPTWHWTYLEFPVLYEFRPGDDNGRFQPAFHGGFSAGVALKCTVSYSGVNGPYRGDCRDRDPLGLVGGSMSPFELNWIAGMGMRVRAGSNHVVFEVRATKGITPVEQSTKHFVLSAAAGIAFPLSRGD